MFLLDPKILNASSPNMAALPTCTFRWTTTQENPETLLMYNILFSFSRALFLSLVSFSRSL